MQVIDVLLTFYLLFYFLRDRRAVLPSLRSLSPLSEASMNKVFSRVGDTIHATIYGTLAVAAVQGTLGGLMFWWLGLPAPVLWGLVMGVLAVVPVLGAFIVWIPAAILLALEGSWGKALILGVWGGVIVGGIDNVMYPRHDDGTWRSHCRSARPPATPGPGRRVCCLRGSLADSFLFPRQEKLREG